MVVLSLKLLSGRMDDGPDIVHCTTQTIFDGLHFLHEAKLYLDSCEPDPMVSFTFRVGLHHRRKLGIGLTVSS